MKKSLFIIIICLFRYSFLFAQQTGVIYGTITDKQNNSPLPGANVIIEGTAIGTITDVEGKFRLMGVPAGDQNLIFSFIGFNKYVRKINIIPGENIEVDAGLEFESTNLEEVTVTAQLVGQVAAINQQLNSDALVDVVSSDKIRELPDINAAEAIGRLPGISINRSGGEAQTINIRGFGADFTSVTINGIKMPETGSDSRSVNLSSISPDLLSHIEVYKSPTADMDGDAIGGIVSLGLKPAPKKAVNQINIYSGFSTLKKKPNYKSNLRLSRRFFDEKLGMVLNSSIDITDRSSQDMSTSYTKMSTDPISGDENGYDPVPTDDLTLSDINRGIQRYGLNFQTDYQYDRGNIIFEGMYNHKNTNEYKLGYNYSGLSSNSYSLRSDENRVDLYQLMISSEYYLSWLEIDGVVSYNRTYNNTPYSPRINFNDPYAFTNDLNNVSVLPDPTSKFEYLNKDYSDATMSQMSWIYDSVENKNLTAAINFKSNYHITNNIAGFVKFGGKVQIDTRSKVHTPLFQNYSSNNEQLVVSDRWLEATGEQLLTDANKGISILNFDVQDKNIPFWNGEYSVWPYLPESTERNWYNIMNEEIRRLDQPERHHDYNVTERLYAAYIMAKLNFQKWVSIVSGVRYEYSDNYYQGKWSSIAGRGNNISGSIKDTSITKSYGHLLPDVHVKITPVKWMNARLSYARTLKRPNYNQVVPTTRVDLDQARLRDLGNGNLNEIIADSYDASISFYTGKFGLFSFGVFSKVFTDYITYSSYVIPPSVALEMGLSDNTFEILDLPVNLPEKGYVKGFEVDFQTNFRYLPKPFNGLILNFNLTRLQSLTQLEKWEKIEYYDPAVRRVVIDFDSSYFYKEKSKLTSQIDMVMNMTLGYEYRGFSFRMSLQYQGLDLINTLNSLETELSQKYNNPWLRMDLAISQEIGKHIKLRFNAANISQQSEKSYIYESHYWLDESRYGAVYQFGLEYNF